MKCKKNKLKYFICKTAIGRIIWHLYAATLVYYVTWNRMRCMNQSCSEDLGSFWCFPDSWKLKVRFFLLKQSVFCISMLRSMVITDLAFVFNRKNQSLRGRATELNCSTKHHCVTVWVGMGAVWVDEIK